MLRLRSSAAAAHELGELFGMGHVSGGGGAVDVERLGIG